MANTYSGYAESFQKMGDKLRDLVSILDPRSLLDATAFH
jgi:hypothetical protein